MPPKTGKTDFRAKSFSFVIHNVKSYESKNVLEQHYKPMVTRMVCACEKYPPDHPGLLSGVDQGYGHIHLFVTFRNARYFFATLNHLKDFTADHLIGPKPEGCTGNWGRVELDTLKGSFEEAKRYCEGLTKDKPTDPNVTDYRGVPNGHIRCDVCQRDFHWVDSQYQYYDERGLGRCFLCAAVRHRTLAALGFRVRNLDNEHYFLHRKYQDGETQGNGYSIRPRSEAPPHNDREEDSHDREACGHDDNRDQEALSRSI